MPDIGFHRPDPAKTRLLRMLLEGFAQRRYLYRIPQLGARAVRFDVTDVPRVDMGFCQRTADGAALCLRVGDRVPIGLAAMIDGAASDDAVNMIAVFFCIGESFQYDYAHSFSGDISITTFAEALAVAVTGDELPGAEQEIFIRMDADVHATSNGRSDSPLF